MLKVGIAGAGLLGHLAAERLLSGTERPIALHVFEQAGKTAAGPHTARATGMCAADAAGGMLDPVGEAAEAALASESCPRAFLGAAQESLVLWKNLLGRLGSKDLLREHDTLYTAFPREEGLLRRFLARAERLHAETGRLLVGPVLDGSEGALPGLFGFSAQPEQATCKRPQTQASHPLQTTKVSGLFRSSASNGSGAIDAQSLMQTLRKHLSTRWARVTNDPVTAVEPRKIITENGVQTFDLTIDCRGHSARPHQTRSQAEPADQGCQVLSAESNWAWPSAGAFRSGHSMAHQLRGVRGEAFLLRAHGCPLRSNLRVFHPRQSLYLVPRGNETFYLGATALECEDHSGVSVRSALELLGGVYAVHHAFKEAEILEAFAGVRPVLPDGLPRVELCDGMMRFLGFNRHGFLLGPALVERALLAFQIQARGTNAAVTFGSPPPREHSITSTT